MCCVHLVATMKYYKLTKSMHSNKQPDIRKATNYMTVNLQIFSKNING